VKQLPNAQSPRLEEEQPAPLSTPSWARPLGQFPPSPPILILFLLLLLHCLLEQWRVSPSFTRPDQFRPRLKWLDRVRPNPIKKEDMLGWHRPTPCFGLILAQFFWANLNLVSFWADLSLIDFGLKLDPTRMGSAHIIRLGPSRYILLYNYNNI